MPTVTFREADGKETVVDARAGQSLMEAARTAGVDGVIAECSGSMVCGTCHVFLTEAAYAAVGKPTEMEQDMLEWGAEMRPTSRLSCQVSISDELDGTIIEVPLRQR